MVFDSARTCAQFNTALAQAFHVLQDRIAILLGRCETEQDVERRFSQRQTREWIDTHSCSGTSHQSPGLICRPPISRLATYRAYHIPDRLSKAYS